MKDEIIDARNDPHWVAKAKQQLAAGRGLRVVLFIENEEQREKLESLLQDHAFQRPGQTPPPPDFVFTTEGGPGGLG
jgi:ADP-heptose:LPS heptosyltransferase